MPVNSYSFKIAVPTSSIPIATSVAITSYSPPSIIPSNAVPTNQFLTGTPGVNITIPANNALVIIYPTVSLYRITVRFNNTNTTPQVGSGSNAYFYQFIPIVDSNNATISFYGTDGVITDTILFSVNDPITADSVTTSCNVSTKSLLIDLPE